MADSFPRTTDLPKQSPLFWVNHKDRYLRQLLIEDIQAETGRSLLVYFTDCDNTGAQIDTGDDVHFAELLNTCVGQPIDLLLETNGGMTDATEKLCSLLRAMAPDLRVVVPRRAKSNGTVLTMCGQTVVLGVESELGPIDPALGAIPAHFVLNAPPGSFNAIDYQIAQTAQQQTEKLARDLLSTGMMKGRAATEIDEVIAKLATRNVYHSHGSVIDYKEAQLLGFHVTFCDQNSSLWKKFWLLRAMYQFDCPLNGVAKLFESARISTGVAAPKPPPTPAP
ncbi:Serine dehydrogenase proteinase [Variovorax sp. NFACC28]|nr:Serine dehydrogenase proteinase [Variovorax sp. NFACC28]SEF71095.1 Serine dehydrogenase proteinase [Variovorax sp. NFACC29]SFB76688.1 Serine dehydrogenase proteinase [Variovorax sp. NFACC26]SFG76355.1 Serine dehydrogenase proteinase [Variovorax sp. NFACC27]